MHSSICFARSPQSSISSPLIPFPLPTWLPSSLPQAAWWSPDSWLARLLLYTPALVGGLLHYTLHSSLLLTLSDLMAASLYSLQGCFPTLLALVVEFPTSWPLPHGYLLLSETSWLQGWPIYILSNHMAPTLPLSQPTLILNAVPELPM